MKVTKSKHSKAFQNLLAEKIGVEAYQVPVNREDCVVVLARLKPMVPSDRTLKMAEARALMFIEDSLKASVKDESWDIRFSRPWVLKKNKIAFTWDFTVQGDIGKAVEDLSKLNVLEIPKAREEEVPIQVSKPKRGAVKQVAVGSIR
jgi:hypothetical protein